MYMDLESDVPAPEFPRMMQLVVLNLYRLRFFEFKTQDRYGLGRVRRLLDHRVAPRLTYLHLRTFDMDPNVIVFQPNPKRGRILTWGAPVLQTLRLEGTDLLRHTGCLSSLTTLELRIRLDAPLTLNDLISALAPCHGTLENLIFCGGVDRFDMATTAGTLPSMTDPSLCLHALKSLTLVTADFAILCEHLEASNLTVLDVDIDSFLWRPEDTLAFPVCLRLPDGTPRFPKVEVLHLWGFFDEAITNSMTEEFFSVLPEVKDLRIARASGNSFLRILSRSASRNFWPKLETLTLSLPRPDLLKKFMRARYLAQVPVKNLSLCDHTDNLRTLDTFVEFGLQKFSLYRKGKSRRYVAPSISDDECADYEYQTSDCTSGSELDDSSDSS